MNVKSFEKENGNAKIVVEVSKETFAAGLETAYRKNRKNIMVPGFRKGKAPRKVIEGRYGPTVFFEDAVNEIFPEVYTEVVADQKIKAVGMPSVSDMDVQEDGVVVLTIVTALYPEVTMGAYKGIEVPKATPVVSDEDVDAELARMAERNARISTVERPIAEGDTVILDFEGFDDGKPFQGGKAENYSLKIGSNQFVPGFEEALIGLSVGDEKAVDVTFPENYSPELAGKPVVFQCKIHEVKETALPALDDEFAKDVSEFDTLAQVKDDIRARFLKNKEEAAQKEFENAAVTAAAGNMTCEVPDCMVEEQIDKHMEQFAYQLQSSGMSMDDYAKMMGGDMNALRGNMRPMAETTVRSNIVLAEIIEAEKIEVSEDEVDAEFTKVAEQYQMEVEKVKELLSAETVKSDLASRKAVKLIADNAVAVAPAVAEEKKAEPKKKPAAKKKGAGTDETAIEDAAAPKKRAPRKKAEPKTEE